MSLQDDSETPWPRVLVGMPKSRTLPLCGALSLVKVAQRGYPIIDLPYSRTDVARNKFAEHLLESQFTHVLMLDDDHQHPDDIVERLSRWVIEDPAKLVIAGLVQRRGEPFDALVLFPDGAGKVYSPIDYPDGLLNVRNEHGPGWVATSAILIAREVFERLEWPWFAHTYPKRGEYPTEDIYFCNKCHDAGIDLWVDTTTESPHMTEVFITKETHQNYIKAHPEMVEHIDRTEVIHGS